MLLIIQSISNDTPLWLIIAGSTLVSTVLGAIISKYADFKLVDKELKSVVAQNLFSRKLDSLNNTLKVFADLRVFDYVNYNGEMRTCPRVFSSTESLIDFSKLVSNDLDNQVHQTLEIEKPLNAIHTIIALLGREILNNKMLKKDIQLVGIVAHEKLRKLNRQLHDACVKEIKQIMKNPKMSLRLAVSSLDEDHETDRQLEDNKVLVKDVVNESLVLIKNKK